MQHNIVVAMQPHGFLVIEQLAYMAAPHNIRAMTATDSM